MRMLMKGAGWRTATLSLCVGIFILVFVASGASAQQRGNGRSAALENSNSPIHILERIVGDIYESIHGDEGDFSGNSHDVAVGQIQVIEESVAQCLAQEPAPAYGSDNASEVLVSAGGSYDATNLIPENVRDGVMYGDGQIGTLVCQESPAYGSNNPDEVLTVAGGNYDASDLLAENVREGISFGIGQVGTLVGYLFGSNNQGEVLAIAGGSYDATNLTPENVRSGITFGDGQVGTLVAYAFGSSNPDEVLTVAGGNYNAMNLEPANVRSGVAFGVGQIGTLESYLYGSDDPGDVLAGAGGSALSNMFNGSCNNAVTCPLGTEFPGGSPNEGGVDDYNRGGPIPADRYTGSWTQCTAANNYCDTGLASAEMRDDTTGLVWSYTCLGAGCSSFADTNAWLYSWDNTSSRNAGMTGAQLCSQGAHGESGWYLPHQKQLLQAYIDGAWGNLDTGLRRDYWSATTQSTWPTHAWMVNLAEGGSPRGPSSMDKTGELWIRCVRSS